MLRGIGYWRTGFLIGLSAIALGGCSLPTFSKKSPPPAESTADVSPPGTAAPAVQTLKSTSATSFDQSIAAAVAAAQEKARAWQSDAILSYVSVELPTDLALNAATTTTVFGSAKDANNWFTYSLSEATAKSIRAIIPKEDYLGTAINPINLNYWKMNYVEAFQLADANGGADFREKHPDARVTLYLSHRAPNQWLWWTVQYKASANALLTLLVNPNQGEVIDSGGTQLVAPPAGTPAAGTPSDSSSTTSGASSSINVETETANLTTPSS